MRTERIWIPPSNELDELCRLSRKFWNEANGIAHYFYEEEIPMKTWGLSKMLRRGSLLWQEFPLSSIPEYMVEKELMKSWKSYFSNITEWYRDGSHAYRAKRGIVLYKGDSLDKGKPAPPKFMSYKLNRGRRHITFRNRSWKTNNGELIISPQKLDWHFETRLPGGLEDGIVRIFPGHKKYLLMVSYDTEVKPVEGLLPNRVAAIDLGLRNIATIANNFGAEPLTIPGGEIRNYLNKTLQHLDSINSEYAKRGIKDGSAKLKLLEDINKKKFHIMHTISNAIIDWCVKNRVSSLAIGYSKGWKKARMENDPDWRNSAQLPLETLIRYIEYKGEAAGVKVVRVDEAHTSACSYFDDEPLEEHKKYLGKREGLIFKRPDGQEVHADLNAAYNIMRRAFPSVAGVTLGRDALSHPRRWPVARV